MDQQQKQTIFDPAKVVAVGIASPLATLLTSRFGIAGTLLGLAISSVILTVLVDALKVYLARASTKVVKVPSGLRTGFSRKSTRSRLRTLFSKVSSLPPRSLSPKKRHHILIGSLLAAGVSFLVGLAIITGVEASVGKSLSCWVWNNCPAGSSTTPTDEDNASQTSSTLPSILGGGQRAISSGSSQQEVGSSSSPQNQRSGAASSSTPQGAPSQASSSQDSPPGAETPTPSSSAQPGQRQGPSGPVDEDQQQEEAPSESSGENPQQQQSPSDTSSSQDHPQSTANNSGEASSSNKDQSDSSSPASAQKPSWQDALQVPWTT